MDETVKKDIQDRLAQLPQVVRDAISSADTTTHLRELSNLHKLHLDQWQELENQVMLTLLAFKELEGLPQNIESEVGVSHETAVALAADISRIVFEPIREELERQLEHPDAQAKEETGVEAMTAQVLSTSSTSDEQNVTPILNDTPTPTPPPTPTPISPLVPPPSAPETKAVRAPLSDTYKVGETSTTRSDVHDDPYRETP